MVRALDELSVCRERVVETYLPAWCASAARPQVMDPALFVPPDWSFLTVGLARWFLAAVDEHIVSVTAGGDFMLGSSKSEGLFEQAGPKGVSPRPMKLRRESFFEIAGAAMLVIRFGWSPSRLTFQSPGWAFDLLGYAEEGDKVAIAGEAKRLQGDITRLVHNVEVCGALGRHEVHGTGVVRNAHKKYEGFLRFTPSLFWLVGPDAFSGEAQLVFRVDGQDEGIVRLQRVDESHLMASRW
jgi:hypothetical protein